MTSEDEMVGWHYRLSGLEFEQIAGDGERQGSLVCCSTWDRKELDTTEQLNNRIPGKTIFTICCAQWCLTLRQPQGLQPARLLCPWNSPGKNTGVGCHSLLQGIFLTQGLNLGLPHWRQTKSLVKILLWWGEEYFKIRNWFSLSVI